MGRPKKEKKKTQADYHRAYNEREKQKRLREKNKYMHQLSIEHWYEFTRCQNNPKQFLIDNGLGDRVYQRMGVTQAWCIYCRETEREHRINMRLRNFTPVIVTNDKTGEQIEYECILDTYTLIYFRDFNKEDCILYESELDLYNEMVKLLRHKGVAHYSPFTIKFKDENAVEEVLKIIDDKFLPLVNHDRKVGRLITKEQK